jgi:tetratricopeptide (TPR) repeat protein
LNRGPQLPMILNDMIIAFYGAGFIEQAYRYNEEKFELQGDSMSYYLTLFILERFQQKYKEANRYAKNAYQINPDDLMAKLRMAWSYQDLNQYDSSIIYYEEYITGMTNSGTVDLNDMNRIGYSYWKIGNQEKANLYFQKQIEICEKAIELGRSYSLSRRAYYDIAGVYAFLGEREKAYEYLRVYNQGTTMTLWDLVLLKTDSMFDSIREEPEFQQIVLDVEAKYQAEHERVRQWLEENEML